MIRRILASALFLSLLLASLAAVPARAGGFDLAMTQWTAALQTHLTLLEQADHTAAGTRIARGPLLKPGMSGERVMQLSQRLVELGYLPAGAERDIHDDMIVAAVQAFQSDRAPNPDGKIGGSTLAALNLTPQEEIAAIRATLASMDEFRKAMPGSFVLVNLPAQHLMLVRDGEIAMTMDTVVGRPSRPTPLLTDMITHVIVNPTWTVPPTVLKEDKLPSLRRTGSPGIDHATVWLDGEVVDPALVDWTGVSPWRVRIVQSAGDHNALGRYRFNLTNGDHIYLHGTNDARVFNRDQRAVSSGCVRLADPKSLAENLLINSGVGAERLATLVAGGESKWLKLVQPMPVRFVYWTATVIGEKLIVLPDIYGIVPPPEQIASVN